MALNDSTLVQGRVRGMVWTGLISGVIVLIN